MSEPAGIYDLERMLKGSAYEATLRAAAIEECAKAVEAWERSTEPLTYRGLINRIRALKDKPC